MAVLPLDLAQRLADRAALALERLLLLQRPWGEFREMVPQTLATLASRGRDAQQYYYLPKPKIFASFEALRTFKAVAEMLQSVAAEPIYANQFRQAYENAAKAFCAFLRMRFENGKQNGKHLWFSDYQMSTTHHASVRPSLEEYADTRHTAEAAHCLLEHGQLQLRDQLVGSPATTPLNLASHLADSAENGGGWGRSPETEATVIVSTHVLNFLRAVLGRLPAGNAKGDKIRLAYKRGLRWLDKKATELNDGRQALGRAWRTDGLGLAWGTSFILHLLGRSTPHRRKAVEFLSRQFAAALIEVRKDLSDRFLEVNLQVMLALIENTSKDQLKAQTLDLAGRLSTLLNRLFVDSMEIGESCYLIQLGTRLAPAQLCAALSRRPSLFSNDAQALPSISALSVTLAGCAEYVHYALRLDELDQRDIGKIQSEVIHHARLLLAPLAKYACAGEAFPPLSETVSPKDLYNKLEDLAGRPALRRPPHDIFFPDLAALRQMTGTVTLDRGKKGDGWTPSADIADVIRQFWTGVSERVSYVQLTGGLSGVDVVLTWVPTETAFPLVIKAGPHDAILNEMNRYNFFVRNRLPNAPNLFGPVSSAHTHAIAYESAAAHVAGVVSGKPRSAPRTVRRRLRGLASLGDLAFTLVHQTPIRWQSKAEKYSEALAIAVGCLQGWQITKETLEEARPIFSFRDSPEPGWLHFTSAKLELFQALEKITNCTEVSPRAASLKLDLSSLVRRTRNALEKGSSESISTHSTTAHGDFHARNIVAVVSVDFPEHSVSDWRLEPECPWWVHSVSLIDFANTSAGQTHYLDYGKYFRDLFERILLPDDKKEQRLEWKRQLDLGLRGRLHNLTRAQKIVDLSAGVFDKYDFAKSPLRQYALIHAELSMLIGCWEQPEWEEAKKRYASWPAKADAAVAILSGLERALDWPKYLARIRRQTRRRATSRSHGARRR